MEDEFASRTLLLRTFIRKHSFDQLQGAKKKRKTLSVPRLSL